MLVRFIFEPQILKLINEDLNPFKRNLKFSRVLNVGYNTQKYIYFCSLKRPYRTINREKHLFFFVGIKQMQYIATDGIL